MRRVASVVMSHTEAVQGAHYRVTDVATTANFSKAVLEAQGVALEEEVPRQARPPTPGSARTTVQKGRGLTPRERQIVHRVFCPDGVPPASFTQAMIDQAGLEHLDFNEVWQRLVSRKSVKSNPIMAARGTLRKSVFSSKNP